jgi:hypothetical protein
MSQTRLLPTTHFGLELLLFFGKKKKKVEVTENFLELSLKQAKWIKLETVQSTLYLVRVLKCLGAFFFFFLSYN